MIIPSQNCNIQCNHVGDILDIPARTSFLGMKIQFCHVVAQQACATPPPVYPIMLESHVVSIKAARNY